jgi:hypothetical protein
MPALWFSPICDQMLYKLRLWRQNYERGEVAATCKFHDPVAGVVDKPTKYMHKIAFRPLEFGYFVQILEALCPNKPLVEEIKLFQKESLPKGQLTIGGARIVSMAFYPEHLDLMIKAMMEARDGKTKTLAEEVKEGGLF